MKFPNPFYALAAAYRAVKAWFKRDEVFVTQEISDERWSECLECPERDPDLNQCKVCSCFLVLKIELATEKCPRRKWKR